VHVHRILTNLQMRKSIHYRLHALRGHMRVRLLVFVATLMVLFSLSVVAQDQRGEPSTKSQNRISKEVRHELLMLPYFGVFDYIAYKVEGETVTLMGQVVRPTLKSDAQNAVKRIEGVESVNNQIEVLPPSSMDDQLRIRLFRAIYGFPGLEKYALGVQKPIRIIVKNGHVTLEGVVDNQSDKDLANIRAKSVPGSFSVDNNLQVVPS
jgi:hyperosmotically inducible protein